MVLKKQECSIEKCDIFDFMANHVGLTVLHPGGFEATRRLAEACHIDKNTRVVDIACGKGTTAVYLAQNYGCSVVGIDISEDLIAQATALTRQKGLENLVSFRVADALGLPFSDNEFDVATSLAILVLVSDKKKVIQEALRVTKPGGYLGWVELSWKKPPTKEFLEAVSNVICAYCMLNVHTYEGWADLFKKAGLKKLDITASSMEFQRMRGMVQDEGFSNTLKVMTKYLTDGRIRKRMRTMDRFFRDNEQYFGYGIYVGRKQWIDP